MFECVVPSGHEPLDRFVTPSWITVAAPPVRHRTAAWVRFIYALSPEGPPISRRGPAQACTLMLKMAISAQLHAMCYTVCCGWRWWTSSQQSLLTAPSAVYVMWLFQRFLHASKTFIKPLLHMLWSYNEFNTLVSAVLTIQSRDFPFIT